MAIERNSNEDNQILIEKLRAIIYIESHKPVSERDTDLIDECVDYLMELENSKELTLEQISTAKESFMQAVEDKYTEKSEEKMKKFRLKPFLVAACFVMIMLVANLVAVACGVDTVAILQEFGDNIVEMFVGEKREFKGTTIIKGNKPNTYSSIDEFSESESLPILYPAELPEGITISEIITRNSLNDENNQSSNYKDIYFVTNSNVKITIHSDPNTNKDFLTNPNYKQEIINSFNCYIYFSDTSIQCCFVHNDYVYFITAPTYDNIVTIVNTLKEIK